MEDNKVREYAVTENAIFIKETYDRLSQLDKLSTNEVDSFDVAGDIIDWARQFETVYDSLTEDSYFEQIDKFAEEKILKKYGNKKFCAVRIYVDIIVPDNMTATEYTDRIRRCVNDIGFSTLNCVSIINVSEIYKESIEYHERWANR